MREIDHSMQGNGANVARIVSNGARLLSQQPWSILPGRPPLLDGRFIPADGPALRSGLVESVNGLNETGRETAVWTPSGAGDVGRSAPGRGSFAGMRWGYTVHSLDGRLVALQRVVFIDSECKPLASRRRGNFHAVRTYFVSSWNGLRPRPIVAASFCPN